MAAFSASEAAFTGFRLIRRHPKVILGWIGAYFVFSLAVALVMVGIGGSALAELQAQSLSGQQDPDQALALVRRMAPAYALILPLTLALYAISYAAVNRLVLRPGDDRNLYLRLGSAELNQFILFLVVFALAIVVYIALIIVGIVIGAVGAFAIAGAAQSSTGAGVGAAALVFLAMFAMFAVLIYLAIRISLASAMTFDLGQLALRRAWRLTRGHVWRMFLAYLILWLLFLFALLSLGVFAAIALFSSAVGGADLSNFPKLMAGLQMPSSALGLLTSPGVLVRQLAFSALFVLAMVFSIGCSAEIYRKLSAPAPEA